MIVCAVVAIDDVTFFLKIALRYNRYGVKSNIFVVVKNKYKLILFFYDIFDVYCLIMLNDI